MSKNMLKEAQDRFWFGRGQYIAGWMTTDTPRTVSNEAFTAGARWATRQTSELNPHIARFIEMMLLLGFLEADDAKQENAFPVDATRGATENDVAATGTGSVD